MIGYDILCIEKFGPAGRIIITVEISIENNEYNIYFFLKLH